MKKGIFIVLTIVLSAALYANPVTRSEALKKATEFMPGKQFNSGSSFARRRVAAANDAFYVFNAEEGGFVIVSGDDRTVPVIGYAHQGCIMQDNLPENLRDWLDDYATQLAAIEAGEATPDISTLPRPEKPALEPLIQTTWNQGNPYNQNIPTYTDEEGNSVHYWTGCVATALAQVMYYHQWPLSSPIIPAYTTKALNINMPKLPATTFKWDDMKLTYDSDAPFDDAAFAVAELMRYVGQANKMDYNKDGSSAYVHQEVMVGTFGYSKNLRQVERNQYTNAEWEDLIYKELAEKRPVLYAGQSETSGHRFICDGYDGNGLFHMNWGWGGGSDGYFVISLANPAEKGIGGGSGTGGFAYGQTAIIGFQPGSSDEPEIPIITSSTSNQAASTYERTSIDADFENVSTKSCFLRASYNYVPAQTYPIEAGWAVWQEGRLLKVVATKDMTLDCRDLDLGWARLYTGPTPVSFGAGLADGEYRLVQVWRPKGEDDWTIASTTNALYAEIAGNQLSIHGTDLKKASFVVNSVSFSGEMAEGTKNSAVVNLTNISDATQEVTYFWMKQGDQWELTGIGLGCVERGETGDVNLTFTQDTPGTYDVRITADADGEDVVWTSTLVIHDFKTLVIDGVVYALNLGSGEAKVAGTETSGEEGVSLTVVPTVSYSGKDFAVTRIADDAFKNTKLTAISLPTTLKIIGAKAFYNKASLTEVAIPEGVESIEQNAFAYCYGLKKLSLPSTLKSIGSHAFYTASKLVSLSIAMPAPIAIAPDVFTCYKRVDDVRVEYFSEANLIVPSDTKQAYLDSEVWRQFAHVYEGELKQTAVADITYEYITGEDFATVVAGDAELLNNKDVVIPATLTVGGKDYGVRKIAERAFFKVMMKSLTIERGIEEIGDLAFWNSYRIQQLVIPEGVKTIGAQAFRYCYALREVSLPSTLKRMDDYAFGNCTRLTSVTSGMATPCAINRNAWTIVTDGEETFTTAKLSVPFSTKYAYQNADVWKEFSTIEEKEPSGLKGDINDDGKVDILDVTTLIDIILGK